jgi:hypothetical protein
MDETKYSSVSELSAMMAPPTPLVFLMELLRLVWHDQMRFKCESVFSATTQNFASKQRSEWKSVYTQIVGERLI